MLIFYLSCLFSCILNVAALIIGWRNAGESFTVMVVVAIMQSIGALLCIYAFYLLTVELT